MIISNQLEDSDIWAETHAIRVVIEHQRRGVSYTIIYRITID